MHCVPQLVDSNTQIRQFIYLPLVKKILFAATLLAILLVLLINAITSPIFTAPDRSAVPEIHVNTGRLENDVAILSSIQPPRNYQNHTSLIIAAGYIQKELELLGMYVEQQVYTVEGNDYQNLICSFGPTDGPRWIVGAHYDVFGNSPGADDNASGVAGLLELARMLKHHNPDLQTRIDLVAYTLEEPPFFRTEWMGSYKHAQYLKEKEVEIRGMVSLEMIGYFSDEENSQQYPLGAMKILYPAAGNYISLVGRFGDGSFIRETKRKMEQAMWIDVRSIAAPTWVEGIDFSDHLNYWEFGYNAIMITNTGYFRNQNYHEISDTPETLDYIRMAEVIRGIYWAITAEN